jgi:GNAT superfamily N-acetyltransferase
MQQAAIVQSIASVGNAIGVRAARHLDLIFRHLMLGQGAESGAGFLRLVTGEPHPLGNLAIVGEPDAPDATHAAVGPLLGCGNPAALIYPNGVSAAVARSVEAAGFAGQGAMPAMAVDIEGLPPTSLPSGYGCARVGAGAAGSAWSEALSAGYGLPRGLARMFSPDALGADMADDARVQFFAIERDGRTVATSMLFLDDGLAGIYCVATLPEERGRGLAAHATAEPLRMAHRHGYRVGVLQSSTAGHSVYLGLGFKDVGGLPMFVRMPAQRA